MKLIVDNVRELKLKQFFLWVSSLGLIAVIIWIAIGIQEASRKSTIDKEMTALIKPINPMLDDSVFSRLEDPFIPPEEFTIIVVEDVDGQRRLTPLGQTPLASPLASRSANPVGTQSGALTSD